MKDDNPIRGRGFLRSNWRLLDQRVSDQNRGLPAPEMQQPLPPNAKFVDLVPAEDLPKYDRTILEAIGGRESRRKYTDESLTIEELSFLLWANQGVRRITPYHTRRTVPSAGSRHSFETYLFAERIEDLPKGLYRYLSLHHKLCLVSNDPDLGERLDKALHGQKWNSAAVFVWTTVPYRTEWRYSIVSHKLIALDAGHVCQNLYLACEAVGCGTCAIGAYDQHLLDEVLEVDGEDQFAVYAAPVGKI